MATAPNLEQNLAPGSGLPPLAFRKLPSRMVGYSGETRCFPPRPSEASLVPACRETRYMLLYSLPSISSSFITFWSIFTVGNSILRLYVVTILLQGCHNLRKVLESS